MTVFTTFEHNEEKRAALIKILYAYRFDKDREKSVHFKLDFGKFLAFSRTMELPPLNWTFE